MEEHPILCNDAMVRAILAGRQTQDRRPIKVPPFKATRAYPKDGCSSYVIQCINESDTFEMIYWYRDDDSELGIWHEPVRCPWAIGDRLWVREAWAQDLEHNRLFYRADIDGSSGRVPYLMDGAGGFGGGVGEARIDKWRPSIHMPRWASRLTLEITNIRVQQVQDISEGDAEREGWQFQNHPLMKRYDPVTMDTARLWFRDLWDSIYAKRGLGWDANPWVWILDFKVVEWPE
jgi:hypothetical protein